MSTIIFRSQNIKIFRSFVSKSVMSSQTLLHTGSYNLGCFFGVPGSIRVKFAQILTSNKCKSNNFEIGLKNFHISSHSNDKKGHRKIFEGVSYKNTWGLGQKCTINAHTDFNIKNFCLVEQLILISIEN